MQISYFESFGLKKINNYIKQVNILNKNEFMELLKTASITLQIEECSRLFTTFLCELKFSYVQQSQRYVHLNDNGYIMPNIKDEKLYIKGQDLLKESFVLYKEMSELKQKSKGRPKKEDYKYGIPIEDARYILPLACKSNITVTMDGTQLFELYSFLFNNDYCFIDDFISQLNKNIPNTILIYMKKFTQNDNFKDNNIVKNFYKNGFNKINDSVVILNTFLNPVVNTGMAAVTSTHEENQSKIRNNWNKNITNKCEGITNRVLGYGHNGIIEHQRIITGYQMSLCAYHQYIRHRLPVNYRESLFEIIQSSENRILVPDTIKNSIFYDKYLKLTKEFKKFAFVLIKEGYKREALYFLLNANIIKIISNTNARTDCDIMRERTCLNAQWEIRNIYLKKLQMLIKISPVIYKYAGPSCLFGKCPEGKMSCGNSQKIKNVIMGKN